MAQSTGIETGKSCILFLNLDEQSWAVVGGNQTVLKKVPDGIEYTDIGNNLKMLSVTVNGYKYENGCPGIMFFADGSCEYSEVKIYDIQEGKNYLVKLNPYTFTPEVNEIQ